MPTNPMEGGGQRPSRCRASKAGEKVTGRAIHTHLMRLPACCTARFFRLHRGARPHQVDRYQRGEEKSPAFSASSPPTTSRKVIPDPYYGPAFHDQPILAIDKVRFIGDRSPSYSRPIPILPKPRRMRSSPNTRNCAVYDEVEP